METRKNVNRIFIYGLLTVLAILVVIPFGWMLLASVKTSNEVFSIPMRLLPKEFQWVNYQTIWEKIPLLTFFKNTFKIAICTTAVQVLTSCFAAYGFSKVQFKGRDTLFLISVTTFAVPWQAYMVTQFALISRMHLTDSHLGLILMQAFSGFGVFLIRQFMIGVSNELLEAARIDGLNEYGIFARVALPLVKYVYFPVRRRLCTDHGCFSLLSDPCAHRIYGMPEVVRGRHHSRRRKGVIL